MKRILLPCALFVFVIAVLLWPAANAVAQDAPAPRPIPSRTPQSVPGPSRTVYEVLSAHKSLGKFAEMIDDADLKSMFNGTPDEPVTVFAPTDDAIDDIPRDVMKRIKATPASLQSFIKYHVIANSLVASSAIRGRRVSPASANGEALLFDGITKKDSPKVNDATLVESDISATNGVIHIVSTALVPPSLKVEPPPPVATPVKPTAPTAATAASVVSPIGATASGSPTQSTTTPAVPPAETTTGAVPEQAPPIMPSPPPQPDTSQQPADDSSKGITLFGHKFGW